MKCPKCQTEINSNAKFCTKCGCNLAAEAAKLAKPQEAAAQAKCVKCGASLLPGARFCTKCGTPNDQSAAVKEDRTMLLYENGSQDDGRTMIISPIDAPQASAPQQAPVQAPPAQQKPAAANMPAANAAAQPGGNEKKKRKSSGVLIAVIVVFVLFIGGFGTVGYLIWSGTIPVPVLSAFIVSRGGSDKDEPGTEESSETAASEEDAEEEGALAPELLQRLDEADALLNEGKDKAKLDSELIGGMESIRDAMNKFDEIAQEAGDASLAADKIADGYAAYATAVIKRKDIMIGQEVSGSVYSQIMAEMNDAESLANELSEKGYDVDASALTSARDEFKKSYTERVVKKFDEFVMRDTVSRTELWNLMSGFDGMFDSANLDDPLRLRYAYALSWWIQKQIETELGGGTITEKGAAIKIANMIEAMDYNPMMINYYITYMRNSNENCADVAAAYNEVINKINSQGIRVGTEIPLAKFWYYNDFGEYSADDKNGVTPENRAWIRDRMKDVRFVKK